MTSNPNLSSFLREKQLFKIAYIPSTEDDDQENGRVSKFGGSAPHLPNEEFHFCDSCQSDAYIMAVQLYIPDLPAGIQKLFPQDKLNSLIVLRLCPLCLGHKTVSISVYTEDQIDSLIYEPDCGPKWATPERVSMRYFPRVPNSPQEFSEIDKYRNYFVPRIITEWKETAMCPDMSIKAIKDQFVEAGFAINQRLSFEILDINLKNGVVGVPYLGGYSHFCNEDETPEGYELLLNFCESQESSLAFGEGGTAQLWVKPGTFEFKFTCSCKY